MSVRQFEEERQQREQFLKRENEALNRHKGELIDKVWALESENKRLREALETITRRKMSCYTSTEHMNRDFIRIAQQALEGDSNA